MDPRQKESQLQLTEWVQLMLQHSSRCCIIQFLLLTERRFQAHDTFITLCFDLSRRAATMSKVNLNTSWASWKSTRPLLESVTAEDLEYAIEQKKNHQPLTNHAVQELHNNISRIGSVVAGSDERKSYMLSELKSSVVYYGAPTVCLTINPADLHSPLILKYCGLDINLNDFFISQYYSSTYQLDMAKNNPLAVVEYFRNTVSAIFNGVLNKGVFGDLIHHYSPFEYQGRHTPHTHQAVHSYVHEMYTNDSFGSKVPHHHTT
jgi:hypothetical protein